MAEPRAFDEMHYHQVSTGGVDIMTSIRSEFISLAKLLDCALPECRSKSLAITHLEDSLMRSIQAVAIHNGVKQ